MPTQTTHTNRLINEKSPYLLQHAHNPVNWYPWGDEAFAKAKAENKPVFLSCGYSTCHWCHVMEHESFEDSEVASLLNENFVSIKVDREERPDVDNFYMNACVAVNGSGGWPLSSFLTSDRKPFFSGTYFPKQDGRYGTGFITILNQITDLWKNNRNEILSASKSIAEHTSQKMKKSKLDENCELAATRQLAGSFDTEYGGFGGAPKFPSLQNILFLLRYGVALQDKTPFEYVKTTLDSMRSGGIYDQIGGGFCRYSTDEKWLIPHFEKMMYDNAFHIMAYSQAGSLIDAKYFDIVRGIAEFCMRDMLHHNGGFFTAIDADSEGVEGNYYVFTPAEIASVLGTDDGNRYCKLYNITVMGNFGGKSIPNLIGTKLSPQDKKFSLIANTKLLEYRNSRIHPITDDKVMSSVNGLMIAALAQAGQILHEKHYIESAERCASFVCKNLLKNGRLQSYWRDGVTDIPASSDDYAYLIWGFIELYEATFKPIWLEKALIFTDDMNKLFWDEHDGGYFIAGKDVDELPVRQKSLHDGALPSGNAVAAMNLVRLSRICANSAFEQSANEIIELMATGINSYPSAYCGILCADLYLKCKCREIILVNGEGIEKLENCLPSFSPFTVVTMCGAGYEKTAQLAPFLQEYKSIDGNATAYLCNGGVCMQPVTDAKEFSDLLNNHHDYDDL